MTKFLPKKLHTSYFILRASESGQALIILLLIMVVGLTVGLSIATRTITDLRISTQSEESQKAFSAAEAGIEDALRRDLATFFGTSSTITPGVTYSTTVTPQGNTNQFVTEQPVAKDDVAQICINVTNLCPNGGTVPQEFDVYWVKQGETDDASLEITEVYESGGTFQISKNSYNADHSRSNGFSNSTKGPFPLVGDTTFLNKATISLNSGARILRIRLFYNNATVAVVATQPVGSILPLQSYKISSTGTSGQITRKVEVTKSLDALPPIFDYVLYSGTDISK
jgi:Tfp pilus assembly protein PilX